MASEEATSARPLVLRMAHNLGDKHPTSKAITAFTESLAECSEGRIVVDLYGGGQLGSEPAVLGQLTQGIIDLTRVGSPGLAGRHPGYHTFGLPYLFSSEEEMHQVMDSQVMRDFYLSTKDLGFVGLTHYSSGARSFYTRSTPVRTPDDLAGLKLRVQDMASQTMLVETLGAAPVVMALGDTYTSLQTGLIDGAESNETVLTESAHGEVAKVFSHTEHTRIPDLMLISADAWGRLSPEDQELLVTAASDSSRDHRVEWAKAIDGAVEKAKGMGVEFVDDVDLDAFQEATAPVRERFAADYQEVADLLTIIDSARKESGA